jgi:hypothetical protein
VIVMTSQLRKLVLAIHLITSVGWIGAASAYLALVVVVLTNQDARRIQDAILVMYLVDWFVIIPFAAVSFLSGLVLSLGTAWGLFKHWWVLFSLLLTIFALFILNEYSLTLREMASVASKPILTDAELDVLKDPGHAVHNIGGLAMLLVIAVLNTYKPRGLTRYGWRKEQEARASRAAAAPAA